MVFVDQINIIDAIYTLNFEGYITFQCLGYKHILFFKTSIFISSFFGNIYLYLFFLIKKQIKLYFCTTLINENLGLMFKRLF